MRYDRAIYFRTESEGGYDEDTGDYYDEPNATEEKAWASICGTTEQMQQLVYGQLKQGSITVHIQNQYKKPFSSVRIGEKIYKVDYEKLLRVKEVFVLSEQK